jgi:hypothetical protein
MKQISPTQEIINDNKEEAVSDLKKKLKIYHQI